MKAKLIILKHELNNWSERYKKEAERCLNNCSLECVGYKIRQETVDVIVEMLNKILNEEENNE